MDLQKIRGQLDQIDTQMECLYEQRMELCKEVAEFKIASGKPVYDGEREKQKIEAVTKLAKGTFHKQAVGELFLQLMTLSRRYQYQLMAERISLQDLGFEKVDHIPIEGKKVVFQGLEGAYSHAAALQYFGNQAEFFHVKRFEDLMIALEEQKADYAVMPIENSSVGAVTDNYDLLLKYNNYIVAETFVSVNHALLGTPDSRIEDIQSVYAHPQALLQSSEFLNARSDWQQIGMENNAVAAKKVRDDAKKEQAAIASEAAGKLYGLKTLAASINHNKENTTRFLILSRYPVYTKKAERITICFELPHKSGSLYNILGNFIFNHVNMRMIESRPIPGKNWEYRFFVDLEGNLEDAGVMNALYGISQEANYMRILGNYE